MKRKAWTLAVGLALAACAAPPLSEQRVLATVWMQSSAEWRALTVQAFNLAADRLDAFLAERKGGVQRPVAVVVDVDETVLDNTPYGAWGILEGVEYERATWRAWVDAAEAVAVPGAAGFLELARGLGVEVFYVTNRRHEERAATVENLRAVGFPFADCDHVLTRGSEPGARDKTGRRRQIGATHDVALSIGDNLGDFDEAFQGGTPRDRAAVVDRQAAAFGRRFIVLPNPTYGEWDDVLAGDRRDQDGVRARRRAALRAWSGPATGR